VAEQDLEAVEDAAAGAAAEMPLWVHLHRQISALQEALVSVVPYQDLLLPME
jgi:hypothetical protein